MPSNEFDDRRLPQHTGHSTPASTYLVGSSLRRAQPTSGVRALNHSHPRITTDIGITVCTLVYWSVVWPVDAVFG